MKRFTMILVLTCLAALPAMADELIGKPDLAAVASSEAPDGVDIAVEEQDGVTVVRVTNSNATPTSVTLGEIPLTVVSAGRLSYEAQMAVEDVSGSVYLEMLAVQGDGVFFSRALDDTFTGTQAERLTSTPFFLEEGDHPDAVRLGVRFESPGTAILHNMELWQRDQTAIITKQHTPAVARQSMVTGIAGSLFGIGSGLWACVASLLAWKGIGRNGVLGVTLGLVVASIIAIPTGFSLWTQGSPWAVWYPVVLLGGIGWINFAAAYFVLRWWYGKTEARRMAAMDM